jgi:hypothetical protein
MCLYSAVGTFRKDRDLPYPEYWRNFPVGLAPLLERKTEQWRILQRKVIPCGVEEVVYRSYKLWYKRSNHGPTSANHQNLIGMCLLRNRNACQISARLSHQLMLSAQDVRYGTVD